MQTPNGGAYCIRAWLKVISRENGLLPISFKNSKKVQKSTKSKPRLKCTMCIINLDTRSFEDSRIQRKTDSFQHGFFSFAEKFKSTLVTSLADAR